jgi:hypothetical protein
MKKVFIFNLIIFLITTNIYAQDTVVIIDENGEPQICKVTDSGAIVCL